MKKDVQIIKPPMEEIYKDELEALIQNDTHSKPSFFKLSPKMVRMFILGSNGKSLKYKDGKEEKEIVIEQKYFGNDSLIERAIITLTGNRGLMLIGEPGTAKTMLSELLTAAISGNSKNTIQGTAGITENSIKYSWNYSLLLSKGPIPEALIPSPIYVGMQQGVITRFEEITRVPSEIQDTLISIMSDKVLNIPETDSTLFARKGFNIIATANSRDRGVNEMSSALKRRFNFETVKPIDNLKLETEIIKKESKKLLSYNDINLEIDSSLVEMLAITFSELRNGIGKNGEKLEKMNSTVSTAEAVSVFYSAALDAFYYDNGNVTPAHIARNIAGSLIKDNYDDVSVLKNYFNAVVKKRGKKEELWQSFYDSKKFIF
jgi:MoxR-like ATPase